MKLAEEMLEVINFAAAQKKASKDHAKAASKGEQQLKHGGKIYSMNFDAREGVWVVTEPSEKHPLVNINIRPIAKAKKFLKDWLEN